MQALVDNCLQTKEEGWKFVRWGLPAEDGVLEPARAVRTALKQLAAVREAVGDDIGICFDVHTRLDLPDAVRLCRASEEFEPFFMEDPLRSESPYAYHRLRQQTAVPLAAGEQYATKWEFREVDRERPDRLCPHRPVHRRRHHRGAQDRRLVRDALHQAGHRTIRSARSRAPRACSSTWRAPTSACRSSPGGPAPP